MHYNSHGNFEKVEERDILVEELFDAEEVFCTGTAVVVNFVNSITYQSRRYKYNTLHSAS